MVNIKHNNKYQHPHTEGLINDILNRLYNIINSVNGPDPFIEKERKDAEYDFNLITTQLNIEV